MQFLIDQLGVLFEIQFGVFWYASKLHCCAKTVCAQNTAEGSPLMSEAHSGLTWTMTDILVVVVALEFARVE